MTTSRRFPRHLIGSILLSVLSLLACSDFFTEPAPAEPVPIAVSLVPLADATAGPSTAFDRVDRVRIRVLQGNTTVADTAVTVAAGGRDLRLRLEVDPEVVGSTLAVFVELLFGDEVLFTGQGTVVPATGQTATVEIALQPRPARIVPPSTTPVLNALGAELQLRAAVEFATGDTIPDAAIAYRAVERGPVQVSPTGLVVAVAEGTGLVEASHGSLSVVFPVFVRQEVVEVQVTPPTASLTRGDTVRLTATPRDPRGNPIPNRAVSWSAEPGEVASVSSNGLVTAIRPGTATVRAMVETVSGTAVISVIQPAAPTPPPQLDAVANGTDVRLTWAYDDTTAARLEVLRLNTSTGTLATVAALDPEATTYEDATGSVDERFEYRIRACNAFGCSDSDPATVETTPRAPAQLGARITNYETWTFVLEWLDQSRFETGFTIQRRTSPTGPWETLATVGAGIASFEGTGTADATVYFRVVACNTAGCSEPSNVIEVTFSDPPPAPPQNLAARVIDDVVVVLTWIDEAATETRYEVARRSASQPDGFGVIAVLQPDAKSYVDNTQTPDERFEYVVRACNDVGCSESNVAAVVTVPTPPADLVVASTDSTTYAYRLEWSDVSRYEDLFVIERLDMYFGIPADGPPSLADGWRFHAEVGPGSRWYNGAGDAGLRAYFRVRACNAAGCSAPSNEIYLAFPEIPPAVVTLSSQAPGVMRGSVNGYASMFFAWFEWDYDPELPDATRRWEFAADGAVGSHTFSVPVGEVVQDTTVYYRIVAGNEAGLTYGDILSMQIPNLAVVPGPESGEDIVCNQNPGGVGTPQPCPETPLTSVQLVAETRGPAGQYVSPFTRVEFEIAPIGTDYTMWIGEATSPTMTVVDGVRIYRYVLTWTPNWQEVPADDYQILAYGITAAGTRVQAASFRVITVTID